MEHLLISSLIASILWVALIFTAGLINLWVIGEEIEMKYICIPAAAWTLFYFLHMNWG